ncbi:MAG: aminotransferase class IV [Deltaproteobacteria bacterium]|nr:aminotransferase class IV [Deltaproteobacteria bacterium]
MSIRVYISGQIVEPEAAKVSVFDRGFLFGDSVYESVGTVGGKLYALNEHLDRLERSAARVSLVLPPREHIQAAVKATVAAAANDESRVRIMVTRGVGKSGELDPNAAHEPQLIVIVQPLNPPAPALYKTGVAVEVVSITRNHAGALDPSVKSGNYLNNVLAVGEAKARRPGVHEAILCSPDGAVAEGATSNVFACIDGVLQTPALSVGILPGITRSKVLAVGRALGVAIQETSFSPDDFRRASEAFITSAARGILPVTQIDGAPVGQGVPGPLTQRLMAGYAAQLNAELMAEATNEKAMHT